MKKVIYDFMERPETGTVIDGSDQMLPPDERVTDAALASPLAGALRRTQMEEGPWPPPRPAEWDMPDQ